MIQSRPFLFLMVAAQLGARLALAQLDIGKKGCYLFQGTVKAVHPNAMDLEIFSGTDSDEVFPIVVTPKVPVLKGATIEAKVQITTLGPLRHCKAHARASDLHLISSHQKDMQKVGSWIGDKCD